MLSQMSRRGRSGREISLKHKYLVLPLFLSQPYFNCKNRPQKHYILWQNSAIYKDGSKALLQEHSVSGHSWLFSKKHFSLFWHNLNPARVQKATGLILHQSWNITAFIQHYYASKLKHSSKASPLVGNSRQNTEDMAVVCTYTAKPGNRAWLHYKRKNYDVLNFSEEKTHLNRGYGYM